jgi:acyl-CoA reductase-like NAD-dependent aldehyde dehydrogenase
MSLAIRPGAPQFPVVAGALPPSDQATMDAAVADLQAHKDAWVALPVPERVRLLDQLIADFYALADRWVAAAIEAKGVGPETPIAAEEWAGGPCAVLFELRQLRDSLAEIARSGRPRIPGPVTTRPDGQVVARVFPNDGYMRAFFMGVTAEIWMQPGVTKEELPTTQAVAYSDKRHHGRVALVLGAGNYSSIGPLDVLYKLFVEDQVVVFKTNPVNAYVGPLMAEAFRALVDGGYLRVIAGGVAEGAYLCNHPGVDTIHITGSDKTFDAIVFGPGPDGAARKAARQPLLTKPVTGELGNVSPVIVVPGPWSKKQLDYHAQHLVTMLANNAGFNCNATRVIIDHEGWGQREQLLGRMRQIMATLPPRPAYYPGAQERFAAFVAAHPEAQQFGTPKGSELPWTLVPGVSPEATDDIVYTTEAFCSVFAETALPAASPAEFVDRAVDFCNDTLWGSLNATILVHPASLKDPATKAAVERAVANLRYGTVALNYWAAAGFLLGTTTWGAFPGHELHDIQSGTGVVHNTLMFDRPQKSVLRAPFTTLPTPPWFVTQGKVARKVFQQLCAFEASPSPGKALKVVGAALGM